MNEHLPTRFESEMTRLMELVIKKIGNLESDVSGIGDKVTGLDEKVSSLSTETGGLKREVAKNSQKLDVLAAQFNDVAVMAIADNKRIGKLERDFVASQSDVN